MANPSAIAPVKSRCSASHRMKESVQPWVNTLSEAWKQQDKTGNFHKDLKMLPKAFTKQLHHISIMNVLSTIIRDILEAQKNSWTLIIICFWCTENQHNTDYYIHYHGLENGREKKMTKFFTHGQVSNNVVPTCCLWFCCWLKQTKRKMFLDCLCNWKLTIPCRSPPLGRPSWNEM